MFTRLVLLLALLAVSPAVAKTKTKAATAKEETKKPELLIAEAQLVRFPAAATSPMGTRLRAGLFHSRLRAGTRVSVLPASGAPFTTTVEAAERVQDSEQPRSGWRLDLVVPPGADRTTLRDDVVVMWPPTPDARALPTSELRASDLPIDTTPDLVKAALGWHRRARPDAVILDLCCSTRERFDMKRCDAQCTELHLREGGRWRKASTLNRS